MGRFSWEALVRPVELTKANFGSCSSCGMLHRTLRQDCVHRFRGSITAPWAKVILGVAPGTHLGETLGKKMIETIAYQQKR